MTIVVDSSVVVKWFADEPNAEEALQLRSEALTAPDFLLVECVNVFWKKVRKGELGEVRIRPAIEALVTFGIDLWPAERLAGRAFQISRELDHAAYDCFYLALAERLSAPFVTADDRLLGKLSGTSTLAGIRAVSLDNSAALVRGKP